MEITDIYKQAVELSLCANAYQFSEDFLGMHKSYYGMLKASGKKPSTVSLVNLYGSIQNRINNLDSNNPQKLAILQNIADITIKEIGKRGSNKSHT